MGDNGASFDIRALQGIHPLGFMWELSGAAPKKPLSQFFQNTPSLGK